MANRGLTTELTQSETLNAKGLLYKAMFFWMQSSMHDQSKANLNNLKKFIEEG